MLPLGGCTVEPKQEQGHPFAIVVKSEEVNVSMTQFHTMHVLRLWLQNTYMMEILYLQKRIGGYMYICTFVHA